MHSGSDLVGGCIEADPDICLGGNETVQIGWVQRVAGGKQRRSDSPGRRVLDSVETPGMRKRVAPAVEPNDLHPKIDPRSDGPQKQIVGESQTRGPSLAVAGRK